jgi:capsid protein
VAQKLTLATSFSAGVAQVDAAADGRLSIALMLEHWAFAAEFLATTATTASTAFSALFAQVFDARFGAIIKVNQDAVLDGLALEVASAQQEPALVAAY